MYRVMTLNLNGIRSAAKKGFFEWAEQQNADVICVQELRAQDDILRAEQYRPTGYHSYFYPAEKKGYSGVGLYCKQKPLQVVKGLGFEIADLEGRYIEADFGSMKVISLYLPSGTSGQERQAAKYHFLERFAEHLQAFNREAHDYIICGDWNIAHRAVDLKNWRGNQKNSGFLPEERAWMDQLFGPLGFADAFRTVNMGSDQYTWWSNRGQAYAKNVGWRIDYQVITERLKSSVQNVTIYKEKRFSDHAPLIIDYKLK